MHLLVVLQIVAIKRLTYLSCQLLKMKNEEVEKGNAECHNKGQAVDANFKKQIEKDHEYVSRKILGNVICTYDGRIQVMCLAG